MLSSTLRCLPAVAGLIAMAAAATTASAQLIDIDGGRPWVVQCRQDQGLQGPRMAQCSVRGEAEGTSETGQSGVVRLVASVVLGQPVITLAGPTGLLDGAPVETATAMFDGTPTEVATANRCVAGQCLFEGDSANTLIEAMQRFDRMTVTLATDAAAGRSVTATFGLNGFRHALGLRAEMMAR